MYQGKNSPWGKIAHCKELAEGIYEVATLLWKGGYKLNRRRNAQINSLVRRAGGWYGEGGEWSLSVISFPQEFSSALMGIARATAKNWFPEDYTLLTGEEVSLEESLVLQKKSDTLRSSSP